MKTRFVIFVVLFGLMCGAVSAQPPVAFDFSAQCEVAPVSRAAWRFI